MINQSNERVNKMRSVKTILSWTFSVLSVITVLASAMPAQAQPVPAASQELTYRKAIAKAKDVRWANWVSLRDPLLEDQKKLLKQVREKYKALIENAGTVAQAKIYRGEMDFESKKVAAEVQKELDKALLTVDRAFVSNVQQVCKQYEKPIPRWLARYNR